MRMKFVIFTKSNKNVKTAEEALMKKCIDSGMELDPYHPDVVFVLGGDGTFLKAVHHFIDQVDSVKFAGIRCGTLGFFYDYDEKDIPLFVDAILNGKAVEKEHRLLECSIDDKIIYAVNEIRVESPFNTVTCEVKIDDEIFEQFRGNGLLVCGSLGSTAYNKSLGGSVISHDLDVLQLTEISAIQNNIFSSLGSPIVLNSNSTITLSGDFDNALIGYDHLTCECEKTSLIKIKASNKRIHILYGEKHTTLSSVKRSFIK